MSRKVLLLFIGVLTAVVLAACGDGKYIDNPKFTEYVDEEISLDNEDEFIIYAFARSCSHCAKFKPVLKDYLNQDDALNVYAYDVDNEATHPVMVNFQKELGFEFEGTPTTIHVKNGKMENYLVGAVDLKDIPVKSSTPSKSDESEKVEIDLNEDADLDNTEDVDSANTEEVESDTTEEVETGTTEEVKN